MKNYVVKAVNGAVSTHMSRLSEKMAKEAQERDASIHEKLDSLKKEPDPKPDPKAGKGTDIEQAILNATAPLRKELEEQKEARAQMAAKAKEAQQAKEAQEEETALFGALTSKNVPKPLAEAAISRLRDSLKRDEKNELSMIVQETGPTGKYEEQVSVEEGVNRFLATDDGKFFLPAKPVAGSGNLGGRPGATGSNGIADHDLVAGVFTALGGTATP